MINIVFVFNLIEARLDLYQDLGLVFEEDYSLILANGQTEFHLQAMNKIPSL